jgi:hypothetical protein
LKADRPSAFINSWLPTCPNPAFRPQAANAVPLTWFTAVGSLLRLGGGSAFFVRRLDHAMKKCSYCGRDNTDDSPDCRECGTEFSTVVTPVAVAKVPSLRSCMPWVVFWHILSFILFAVAEEPVIWLSSVLAFWPAVTIGLIRRKGRLTKLTALVISHGLVLICAFAMYMFYFVAHLRGLI